MDISPELAQSIVDRTMEIIDYNINIMNSEARIIASGDPKRIGEFHQGAAVVLQTGREYVLDESEASKYENVVPGISFPIHFQNTLIGAVGMGGGVEINRKYGEILQFTTELLLEQAFFKDELALETQAKNNFFQDLLLGTNKNDAESLISRANLFHISSDHPYLVIVVETSHDYNFPGSNDTKFGYSKFQDYLLKEITLQLEHYKGLQTTIIADYLTILIPCPEKDFTNFEHTVAEELSTFLNTKLQTNILIGVGGVASSLQNISTYYSNAIHALKMAHILNLKNTIAYFDYLFMEHTLYCIPLETRRIYYNKILHNLLSIKSEQQITYFHTLQTYFENELSLKETADALFIHRNTLLFRLNRIKEITGLQPQNFHDAVKLYFAILMWQME